MRVVTSAKYETPSYDRVKKMIKLVRKGFDIPEFTESVKFVDREHNKVYFYSATDFEQV